MARDGNGGRNAIGGQSSGLLFAHLRLAGGVSVAGFRFGLVGTCEVSLSFVPAVALNVAGA